MLHRSRFREVLTAGLFPPIPTRPVVTYVHGVSGLVVIIVSPIVFLLANWSLVRESAWLGISRHLQWVDVVLVDLDHGQPTALGRERVTCARLCLLLAEQRVPSNLPLGV